MNPDTKNASYYYKMVSKIKGKYYSVYQCTQEYIIGEAMYQKAKAPHKAGYYVYPTIEQAVFADV